MSLSFERIINTDADAFKKCWQLYEESFPLMERRELIVQTEILKFNNYHFDAVYSNGALLGFILWWQFNGIIYIEHLATFPALRGRGIGGEIIEVLLSNTRDKVILEVELPVNRLNKRRIDFYQRLGFHLNHHNYYQPPLRKGGDKVQLLLMSWPGILSTDEVDNFVNQFYRCCFQPVEHLL